MNIRIASSRGYGLLLLALFLFMPLVTHAVPGANTASDAMCAGAQPVCTCNQVMGPKGCQPGYNPYMCPCQQTDNGFTTSGMCLADQRCHAMSTGGKSPDQGLSQLGQMLSQLMQQLMKGGGGGGGSGSGSGSGSQPCTTYSQTSDPTRVGVDPCSYYVPSAASQINIGSTGATSSSANDLLNALGGGGSLLSPSSIGTPTGGPAPTTQGGNNTGTPAAAVSQQILNNIGSLNTNTNPTSQKAGFSNIPGVVGNILFTNAGATIFASTVNSANNSALSGFYGSDNGSVQPQGVVTGMCQNRPWASNFLSNFIPSSFFDSLCQWGGYQVGKPPAPVQPQVTLSQTQTSHASPQPVVATSSVPSVQPIVQIWAVPATVPLGTRTSIFWKTQGVTNCTETSPDGSFSQNSIQGAGATVPITSATTFTISCMDSTGNPITNYVTVNLKI